MDKLKAVFIEFGHGGNGDVGASTNGTTERKELLDLQDDLQRYWDMVQEFKGVNLYFIGYDKGMEIPEKVVKTNTICRQNKYTMLNSVFLSLHFNTGGGSGPEGWYRGNENNSMKLADKVTASIAEVTGLRARISRSDSKNRYGRLGILYVIPTPALIECGFLDNSKDASIIKDPIKEAKIAQGVIRGIKRFCGINT